MSNYSPFDTRRIVLRDIGKCIYCLRSDVPLSEEHIIPYGLNGNFVIRNASCQKCGAITSAFELDVLRNTFMLPRKVFNMRSRHRRKGEEEIPAKIETETSTLSIKLPKDDCPVFFVLPIFLPPAILDNRPYKFGIQGTGLFHINEIRGIAKDKLRKKHGGPQYLRQLLAGSRSKNRVNSAQTSNLLENVRQ